jgi:hypothetical protein
LPKKPGPYQLASPWLEASTLGVGLRKGVLGATGKGESRPGSSRLRDGVEAGSAIAVSFSKGSVFSWAKPGASVEATVPMQSRALEIRSFAA